MVGHVRRVAPAFLAGLAAFRDHPLVGDVRGVGLIAGVELMADKATRMPFEPSRKIGVLVLHPGWVKTDMGGPNAEISTETSVRGMRAVMDKFKLKDSGRFIAYDGEELPW